MDKRASRHDNGLANEQKDRWTNEKCHKSKHVLPINAVVHVSLANTVHQPPHYIVPHRQTDRQMNTDRLTDRRTNRLAVIEKACRQTKDRQAGQQIHVDGCDTIGRKDRQLIYIIICTVVIVGHKSSLIR